MPYEIRVDRDLLVLRFFGVIEPDDLRQSLLEVEEIEAKEETAPDRVTDLSKSDTAIWSSSVVEALAERRRHALLKNRVKSAIYAPNDLQFGYSRMFQMLNDNPQIEVAVFREFSEAAVWLGVRM